MKKARPCKTCHGTGQVASYTWKGLGGFRACPNCGGSGERFPIVLEKPR